MSSTISSSVVVTWLLLRSIRPYLPDVPYGPTITMCLTAAHILSTWVANPDELHLSYKFFLDIHGGKSRAVYHRLSQAPTFVQMIVHPKSRNNFVDVSQFWVAAFRRALKVYFPLYTAFFIFSKYRYVCVCVCVCMVGFVSRCVSVSLDLPSVVGLTAFVCHSLSLFLFLSRSLSLSLFFSLSFSLSFFLSLSFFSLYVSLSLSLVAFVFFSFCLAYSG
jgi:hypothetical protein